MTLSGTGARTSAPSVPVGLADNDHGSTFRQPYDRTTAGHTALSDGHTDGILAWTGEYLVSAYSPRCHLTRGL